MAKRRRNTAEQIITKLREAEIYPGQDKTVKEPASCWKTTNKPTIAGA